MFIEAQQAFHQAGKTEDALTVLEKLTSCAVRGHYFAFYLKKYDEFQWDILESKIAAIFSFNLILSLRKNSK